MSINQQNSKPSVFERLKGIFSRERTDPAAAQIENISAATETLQTPDIEEQFKRAILGSAEPLVGRYQCYTDFSVENTIVVFVHDATGESEHKYIIANAGQRTFIVAAPVEWTGLHRAILSRISNAISETARCPGGGYLKIDTEGDLVVNGRSQDFGPGNHDYARKALLRAVLNSKSH